LMGRAMKDTLYLITALVLLSSTVGWFWVTLESDTCGQVAGTTIIGDDDESGGSGSSKIDDDLIINRFVADYSCTIDEIFVYLSTNFATGDYATAGIYDDSGNLLEDTDQIQGNDTAEWKTFTLDSTVQLTQGTAYWLGVHFNDSGGG
jgi:hypothetical protein